MIVDFGKYKGKDISEISPQYLAWYCIKNDEGETSIYNNPGLIMPVGYENVTEDGCEFLIVKKL